MILLDTHVVIWLFEGRRDLLSEVAVRCIEENVIGVSPMVRLELEYLAEIGRIRAAPDEILADLSRRIGLHEEDPSLSKTMGHAMSLSWTRDPFDRLIVAHARATGAKLVTADRRILENFKDAAW